ncbi:uncharacterized protein KQ657_002371 [Scheffersomyces spartinae]|uniref:Uncharacterized protein n=1 Tax=Scheffersomyces spartinae TaxID=45513 RepID=A0A9P7VDT7_9ASCO|nr:uncharacterized protein KQ657_002371 [Scheffersomyces spartinae]KAG7195984.1 hypothetical protein KQ657_002371 [Scheffersomyces spartinae]
MAGERKPSAFDRFYDMEDDNPLVRFYDAEQKLTTKDRTELGESLKRISFYSSYAAYGSATVAYFLPTIVYNYKNPGKAPPITINGKQVKPMFVFRRPFFSVFLSFGTLLVTKLILSTYLLSKAGNETTSSQQRQIWEQLRKFPTMGLGIYGEYFTKSATDDLIRMRNPREMAKELRDNPNAVRFFPSLDNLLRMPVDPKDPSNGEAWQHLREENGFPARGKKSQKHEQIHDGEASHNEDTNIEPDSTLVQDTDGEHDTNESSMSSWERLRKSGSTK